MLRLDIRTKIIILLTISTSTFIVNTLWIEVLCVIILSGMQLAFGKKVFSKRCLPIRKHRGAREKRYSFGYAVFLILALMK